MNIQIIGTKKHRATRAAERYFRERGVAYQFVDLSQRGLSTGELTNIAVAIGKDNLIDEESPSYRNRGMQYMDFDILDEIEADPLLLRQPIVRNGRKATVGTEEDTWRAWIEEERTT